MARARVSCGAKRRRPLPPRKSALFENVLQQALTHGSTHILIVDHDAVVFELARSLLGKRVMAALEAQARVTATSLERKGRLARARRAAEHHDARPSGKLGLHRPKPHVGRAAPLTRNSW
eukprot:3635700-Prymnesium_polylepis.1